MNAPDRLRFQGGVLELEASHRRSGPVVFLDRDGTLIHDPGYLRDPEQVRLLPGVAEALARFSVAGYGLVVISNQSGVGRGLITIEELKVVHLRLEVLLAAEGLSLHGAWYCTHRPEEGCDCRKPRPGLLLRAGQGLGLLLGDCWMIGDRPSDADAGRSAGCRALCLDAKTPDLLSAADLVLAEPRGADERR